MRQDFLCKYVSSFVQSIGYILVLHIFTLTEIHLFLHLLIYAKREQLFTLPFIT